MEFDQTLHDRQAEACAVMRTIIGGADLEERIADVAQIVFADADTGIFHGEGIMRRRRLRRDRDFPPRWVNLMALDRRLIRICFTARLSATMSGRSAARRQTRSMPASRARSAIRSQQVPITGAGANGSGVISKLPDSIFDMSRMPFTTDTGDARTRRSAWRIRAAASCRAASFLRWRASRRSR